ncbi:asparagine synthase (glutamine-hydrolyzing) [Amycolatopsis sp. NPDC059021]|uniref:asparagine synthase (glutamine-hydrolyzing) n=1 Tax=Amycolatopsis sp. NPDC059021 TaxID=3346704 RepID=UPI00366D2680
MCGITGWVDFGRDLADALPTLRAMTDALARRGVDDRDVWQRGHAALGHTRTAIIDPAGGHQPLVAEEAGEPVAVLVYNGEVYNFKQLRAELRRRGHRFRTACDSEVLLRAYLEWGAACAERLDGIFAFAVWDIRREELVLVRDRLGVKPLFYTRTERGVLFGSEPKALLAHPQVRPVVALDGLRELFSIAKQPGTAVFRDMREVRPGHTLTVGRSGVSDRTYWTLTNREHTDDRDQTVRTIRSMLDDIVLRELVADVPVCTALSGGLDSSALTAIASDWLWKLEGGTVRTFSTTYRGHTENFRPDDVRFTPDGPYALEMARHVASEHTDIVLTTDQLIDPETRLAVLLAQDAPTTLGDMDTSNYLMSQAIRRQSTVVLSGEVSDEIFGGYNWMSHPACVHADTFPWVVNETAQAGSQNGQGRGLFDRGLMQKLAMPEYYAENYRQALGEVSPVDSPDAMERRMHAIGHLTLTRWLPMLLDRGDRLSMAHGLELRVPFCDHRLVEYLYNTPWRHKTFDGREKSLLRAAVADLLPASVLDRRKSPWPVTQDPSYTAVLHRELAAVLADTHAPIRPFLDVAAAERTLASDATDWPSRMNIEMALQFNSWLTTYDVELAV